MENVEHTEFKLRYLKVCTKLEQQPILNEIFESKLLLSLVIQEN